MFAKARQAFDEPELEDLGAKMMALKQLSEQTS
jgi:hypothetical protein